jgi:hypothetical protein
MFSMSLIEMDFGVVFTFTTMYYNQMDKIIVLSKQTWSMLDFGLWNNTRVMVLFCNWVKTNFKDKSHDQTK